MIILIPGRTTKQAVCALTEKGRAGTVPSGTANLLPGRVREHNPFLDALARVLTIARGLKTAGREANAHRGAASIGSCKIVFNAIFDVTEEEGSA